MRGVMAEIPSSCGQQLSPPEPRSILGDQRRNAATSRQTHAEQPLRHTGKVTDWNDERGFGFVVPDGDGDRAFLHISQVKPRSRRPVNGDQVAYATSKDSRGRLQATRVRYRTSRRAQGRRAVLPRATLGLTALALVAAGYFTGLLPRPVAGAYLLCTIISFLAYWKDKHAARHDRWRTPESTLHLFDLLGD